MIMAEVVFDGDVIRVNGHEIHNADDGFYDIYMSNDEYVADYRLEQAIAYCLEQKK